MSWRDELEAAKRAQSSNIIPQEVQTARDAEAARQKIQEYTRISGSDIPEAEKKELLAALSREIAAAGFTPPNIGWRAQVSELTAAKPPATPASAPAAQQSQQQSSALGAGLAALRGYGQSATAGLGQYASAPLIMATRALTGGEPLSYAEALEEVKSQARAARQEYPRATTIGTVAGVLPAIAAGGPATLGAITARGAGYGAAQGFSERESGADALRGATTGALFNFGLGTLGKAAGGITTAAENKFAQTVADYANKQNPNLALQLKYSLYSKKPQGKIPSAEDLLMAPRPSTALESRQLEKAIKYLTKETKGGIYGYPAKEVLSTPVTREEVKKYFNSMPTESLKAVTEKVGSKGTFRNLVVEPTQSGLRALYPAAGAGGGAALGGYMMGIEDPLLLAGLALAGGGGGSLLQSGAAQAAAGKAGYNLGQSMLTSRSPLVPTPAGLATAGEAAGRAATALTVPQSAEAATTTTNRLRQIADEFRAKFGTQ